MNVQQAYIHGFVKKANEHGLSSEQAINLLKTAAEDGPYRTEQAALAKADDAALKALIRNRKEHFGHYMLNPLVGGPITEAARRLMRRFHQGNTRDYGGLINTTPPPLGPLVNIIRGNAKGHNRADEVYDKYLADIDAGYGK